MNFLSLSFYLFIPIFLIMYYIVPKKYRYIVICIGSYTFYGYSNFKMLVVLIGVTIISYIGGLAINRKHSKGMLAIFVILEIAVLGVFKYLDFAIDSYNLIISKFMPNNTLIYEKSIVLPVGLSFMVFQSITYLSDVYRKNIEIERNIIRYAAFVAFFPTVLSGPIQKARELLPQIKNPNSFDGEQAKKGTILFVWGLFEKIVVANRLLVVVNKVFNDYASYNSAYYIVAGIAFTFYIYADFSSYSDMARGIAKLMGINVCKNFNNPYLSVTTSEFWNRWHTSLNDWFIENIYIPLGGNRKGTGRKYVNVFIVFLISGLWHGAQYHFVVWGVINGILVIIGQIIKPLKSKIYSLIHVDENCDSIIFCKRAIVFWLITLTWVFFNNGIYESLYIVKNMVMFNPINFFDENLFSIAGTVVATFITILSTAIFCRVQTRRINESDEYNRFSVQPFFFQSLLIALLICACVFTVCSTDTTVNTQFLYYQF